MILDPRNRGVSLNQSQRKEALELLQKKVLKNPVFADKCGQVSKIASRIIRENMDFQIMNEYYNWLSKAGPFADARDAFQVLEYGIETVPWWKGSFPDLSLPEVVSFVYSVPATSAAAERNWSLRGATHTPSRNRLLVDTATKMTYIKHNLLLIDGSKTKPHKQHSNPGYT